MTHSLTTSIKPVAAFAALAWTALTFCTVLTPTPAHAENGPFYRAELAAPAHDSHEIAGGVAWNCNDTTCAAPRGTSRPVIMCARLAKEVGTVTRFTVDGEDLAPEVLARCNGE
jgi:hypothetical protein